MKSNDTTSEFMEVRLQYVLLASDADGGYTPFQGFGNGITSHVFPPLIEILAVLPASPIEILDSDNSLVELRSGAGRKQAAIVGVATFLEMQADQDWGKCIPVIIGLAKDIDTIGMARFHPNAIVVTNEPRIGATCIFGHDTHIAQLLDNAIKGKWAQMIAPTLRHCFLARPLRAPFPVTPGAPHMTGATLPNEFLCVALGHSPSDAKPVISAEPGKYADAIMGSVDRARAFIGEASTDIVLYAPSISGHLYSFDGGFWNRILRQIPSRALRNFIKDGVFRNKGYSGYKIMVDDPKNPPNPYQDPVASALLKLRQTELRLVAAGITALAASATQPAIRLPNAVNFCAPILREIERHAKRNDPRGQRLLQSSYVKLADLLSQNISPKILADIESNAEAITLVTDAPLEWMRIAGLPLMIRHETSRIGMTPGNLMLSQSVSSGVSLLPSSQLKDVLVIRSFSDKDPVKHALESAVKRFNMENVKVRFIDVGDRESLVSRLNEFEGVLVVFDCHGDHDGKDGNGWLCIGQDRVDPWSLAGEARIPPIAVLSACSTFALAGSHASVANGLLLSGATTVLGTFLPVNADLSAILVARILYRVDAFLPALRKTGYDLISWRSFITGFLRMSYASDLLHYFIGEKGWIDREKYEDLGLQANFEINGGHPEWYQRLLERFAAASLRTTAEIQKVIDIECPLLETMYYCQVGRPENIGIYLSEEQRKDRNNAA
ncbi:hypothetical protein [Stenotrophomonas lacuserhaii]|uniref:hypothetical protein n=1 Tax=Stenotrophomonas lacuserhaii TaxID=2760084 RepID=UPI0015FC4312|nr:hypothetical protein [Stenotrophomonas lacuserhaii]